MTEPGYYAVLSLVCHTTESIVSEICFTQDFNTMGEHRQGLFKNTIRMTSSTPDGALCSEVL